MTGLADSVKRAISFISAIVVLCFAVNLSESTSYGADVEQEDLNNMAKEIALLVNEARTEEGLKPLYVVPYLNDVAQIRARECIFDFSHDRPDGSSFASVIDDNLIPYCYAAENIAAGSSTAAGTFNQWKNSPRHWESIMNPDATHMGVGVCYEKNSEYKWYWQQIFIQTWDDDTEISGQFIPEKYEIVPKSDGDLNGDANINSYDYIVLVDYIRKKQEGERVYLNDLQMEAADCFRDGIITESDAKALQRYILGEYDELPYIF